MLWPQRSIKNPIQSLIGPGIDAVLNTWLTLGCQSGTNLLQSEISEVGRNSKFHS